MIVVAVGDVKWLPDHYGAGQGGNRIDIGSQNGRNLGYEDIARQPATDAGQHSEQRRRDRGAAPMRAPFACPKP